MKLVFALALAAAPLAACAPAAGGGTSRPAPSAAAPLLRLEDRREYDPAVFQAALTSPSAPLRRRAALAAGRIRDRRSIAPLGALLGDADTAVVATAAFALGQIGDTAAVPLLAPLADPARIAAAPTVVGEAAYALGKLRHPQARAALERLLTDAPREGAGVREAVGMALLAIWRQGRPTPVDAIAPWLRSADPELRWRAAYALARRAEPRATAALFPHAADADPLVRSFVARGLTGPMADSAGIGRTAAQDALGRIATQDPAYEPRINALRSLGTFPGARTLALLSDVAANPRNEHEAIAALESIQRLGKDAASSATFLAGIARSDTRPVFIRQTALTALADVDSTRAAEVARALETSPEWRLRAAAVRAVAGNGPGNSRLMTFVADPDPRIGAAAIEQALTAAGDSVGRLRDLLMAGLAHRDAMVRTNALAGLARLADPATLPAVLDAYQRAQTDTLNDAALAAVDAVAAIDKKQPGAAAGFLARFPRSADYLVRQRVNAAWGDTLTSTWGAPLPIETNRSPADYERMAAMERRGIRRATIVTSRGDIHLELFAGDAPQTVNSFLSLAASGFFDGQEWPRVVPNFVIQGGDPRGDTSGGPGYVIRDELNRNLYLRGTLGMALSGPDTGGSQWFVTHSPQPHLDATYTVFGRVTRGMEVADRLLPGDGIIRIRENR
ncbi:MAG TPA: HEAT repeat domain-containing protein [Longimicrobium sp.]|jgi:cyclophilin family peptidyl-prolyl cis-trans isomerase/HEAT repeat protein|uniref:HEAT repeat domain-containing protein n=1 Tax=Longimicrobium sp. TaxID=2029185 RepID=UPI002ED8F861